MVFICNGGLQFKMPLSQTLSHLIPAMTLHRCSCPHLQARPRRARGAPIGDGKRPGVSGTHGGDVLTPHRETEVQRVGGSGPERKTCLFLKTDFPSLPSPTNTQGIQPRRRPRLGLGLAGWRRDTAVREPRWGVRGSCQSPTEPFPAAPKGPLANSPVPHAAGKGTCLQEAGPPLA